MNAKVLCFVSATMLVSQMTLAQDAQKDFEKNLQNAREVSERLQNEREREALRDRSHDFPRVRVEKDTSIGIDANPERPGVNVRRTTQ